MTTESELICIKKLALVSPVYARTKLGLIVDRPIFTSHNDPQPFSYEVGKTYRFDGFFDPKDTGSMQEIEEVGKIKRLMIDITDGLRPRVGITYDETDARVVDEWGQFDINTHWIAIVEPTGTVFEPDDVLEANRITNELRVKEIRAFCASKGSCRNVPLNQGSVIENPHGLLLPFCSIDSTEVAQYFEIPPSMTFERGTRGEIVFNKV